MLTVPEVTEAARLLLLTVTSLLMSSLLLPAGAAIPLTATQAAEAAMLKSLLRATLLPMTFF
jgi:hypothetical protein